MAAQVAAVVAAVAHALVDQEGVDLIARHKACVLDGAVFIEQATADDADLGTLGLADQLIQPVAGADHGVVVEEDQHLGVGLGRGEVVHQRPVELPFVRHDARLSGRLKVRQIGLGLRVLALMVDDQQFMGRGVGRAVRLNALDAGPQQIEGVLGGDDDAGLGRIGAATQADSPWNLSAQFVFVIQNRRALGARMRLDRRPPRRSRRRRAPAGQQHPADMVDRAAAGVDAKHELGREIIARGFIKAVTAQGVGAEGRAPADIGRLKQQIAIKTRLEQRIGAAAQGRILFLLAVQETVLVEIDRLHPGVAIHASVDPAQGARRQLVARTDQQAVLAARSDLLHRRHDAPGRRRRLDGMDRHPSQPLPGAAVTQILCEGGLTAVDDQGDRQCVRRHGLRHQAADRVVKFARRSADGVDHRETATR